MALPQPTAEEEPWPILSGEEAAAKVPYTLAPSERVTQCPYDPSHWILLTKTLTHLNKCRKNFVKACRDKGEEPEPVACRYDRFHEMYAPEIKYHESQCKARESPPEEQLKAIERYAPPLEQDPHSVITPEEEWHGHPTMRSYDPREKLRSGVHLIPHCNAAMNKSEKKAFQAEQRVHFFTRAVGTQWKELGSEQPEILGQPIVTVEDDDSVAEALGHLRFRHSQDVVVPPPTPRPGRRSMPDITRDKPIVNLIPTLDKFIEETTPKEKK